MGTTNLDVLDVKSVTVSGLQVAGARQAAQANTAAATAVTIAAANSAAAVAATATTILAAVPVAAPAGGVGAAAGGWDTAANRDAAIVTINDLRTHAIEMDLDYEALLLDVADIRTKYAVAVTLVNELKVGAAAMLVDVAALRTTVNALLAKLRTHGIIAT